MTLTSAEWVERYAGALGLAPPSDAERDALLDLAGVAAHAAERTAAPLSCWLAARAGVDPAEALALAHRLVEQTGRGGEAG